MHPGFNESCLSSEARPDSKLARPVAFHALVLRQQGGDGPLGSHTLASLLAPLLGGLDQPILRSSFASLRAEDGRSQSQACVGCIVSSTTAIICALSCSRLVSVRSVVPNAASVRTASYLRR